MLIFTKHQIQSPENKSKSVNSQPSSVRYFLPVHLFRFRNNIIYRHKSRFNFKQTLVYSRLQNTFSVYSFLQPNSEVSAKNHSPSPRREHRYIGGSITFIYNQFLLFAVFQDVHVMIFLGFGLLMSFLKRYSFSSMGFTLLLGSFLIQWSMLCQGFYNLNDNYKIELGIERQVIFEIISLIPNFWFGVTDTQVCSRKDDLKRYYMKIICIQVFLDFFSFQLLIELKNIVCPTIIQK